MRWRFWIIELASLGAVALLGCSGLPLGRPAEHSSAGDASGRMRAPHAPVAQAEKASPSQEQAKLAAHSPPRLRRLPQVGRDGLEIPPSIYNAGYPQTLPPGAAPGAPPAGFPVTLAAWNPPAPSGAASGGDPVDVMMASLRGRPDISAQEAAHLEGRLRELLRESSSTETAKPAAPQAQEKPPAAEPSASEPAPAKPKEAPAAAEAVSESAEPMPRETAPQTPAQEQLAKSEPRKATEPGTEKGEEAPASQEKPAAEPPAPIAPDAAKPVAAAALDLAASSDSEASPAVLAQPEAEPAAIEAAKPRSWRELLVEAIDSLERELAEPAAESLAPGQGESPREPHDRSRLARDRACQQITLRVLKLLAGQKQDALRPIEGLDPREQEYWKHQLHGLSVQLDEHGTPIDDHRWRLALRSFREALHYLAVGSSLEVRNLAFCTSVHSFGRFEEFERAEFRPGQEVLLYVEIDNFSVEQMAEGYLTELQASYRIATAQGHRVAEDGWPAEREVCRNRRRDYFVPYRLYMPQRIYPGNYILTLTVEDLRANKFGQATIQFTIVP